MNTSTEAIVRIGSEVVSQADFERVVLHGARVEIDPAALEKVEKNHRFLLDFAEDKVIYGINTGFGPMAQHLIGNGDRLDLQYNLIRSHASGTGAELPGDDVRALVFARLVSLLRGSSGIHPALLHSLIALLNEDVRPVVFAHGGVGASGDLVQLAHLALTLIGEGEVRYRGERQLAREVYERLGIEPFRIRLREGLALLNGTSAMTGMGLNNLLLAERLLQWSILASSMINELVAAYDDAFSQAGNEVKLHPGQSAVAAHMRAWLKGSSMLRKRENYLYNGKRSEANMKAKVQEYYSLRCVPQILGPVMDTVAAARQVLVHELNSVNDNPIVDDQRGNVFHGGNFHGDYVSLEMDKLKLVVTRMAMLAERQLNFLLNPNLNQILPPFANMGRLGFNFGLQGMQFTATSTTAECQTLSGSMYVHSMPTNNDNQDLVSMGANSARICSQVITNAFEVMGVEMAAILQCIDILGIQDRLAPATRARYGTLRQVVPPVVEDKPHYHDLGRLIGFLRETNPDQPSEENS